MKVFKLIFFIGVISGIISACQKEFRATPAFDPSAAVSFSNDLQPILTSECAKSGCHDKSYQPNLLKDKSYSALTEGGYIDTIKPSASTLMIRLNKDMPKGKLPQGDINKFEAWITQGAKDN